MFGNVFRILGSSQEPVLAEVALVMVSAVVNVLEAIKNKVVSGFKFLKFQQYEYRQC